VKNRNCCSSLADLPDLQVTAAGDQSIAREQADRLDVVFISDGDMDAQQR
jgi:hypothetical protein